MAKDEATAAALIPAGVTLPKLRELASACTACELYKKGTQTVFGEGDLHAPVMMVGEQPGDQEDKQGKPFVGPAGRLLDRCLEAAGIDRTQVYVTNVVKHFKWEPRGKRRIHEKPNVQEIRACKPWLEAEISLVRPRLVVCLGATAAQAVMGKDFRVTKSRGQLVQSPAGVDVIATVHPSSLLRAPDEETYKRELASFVTDLRAVAAKILASN
jgi:DNA polymerase